MPPPRVVVEVVPVPARVVPVVPVLVVPVPVETASSRVEVVVVVVSGLEHEVKARAITAAAGARIVNFFISLCLLSKGDSRFPPPADVFRQLFLSLDDRHFAP